MPETPSKRKFWRSLRVQIGLLYLALALLNITFFSLMILEDQNDLVRSRLKQTADNIVVLLGDNLNRFPVVDRGRDEGLDRLTGFLKEQGADSFVIFDAEGLILHEVRDGKYLATRAGKRVADDILKRTLEIGESSSVLYKPYHAGLDPEDYSLARFLLPLRTVAGERAFLHTTTRLDGARELLGRLYIQVGLAVLWGLAFFLLFAFLIYRLYIRRINQLTRASRRMAAGDLGQRLTWNFSREDEIDEMGSAFNSMAENIQHQVETVTELNDVMAGELETGRQVQGNFLPEQGVHDEFQAVVTYRPLRAVSGDIYNFYRLPRDRRAILIADAAGHGPSAAIITAVACTGMDDALRQTRDPVAAIGRLNDVLEEKLSDEFFMTAAFLVIDKTRRVHYINAGHPPILVLRPGSGEVFELYPNGPPLGIMPGMRYDLDVFKCKPGDRLVMYSDALYESLVAEDEPLGLERFKEILVDHVDLGRSAFSDAVISDFESAVGRVDDDLTLIVMDV